MEIIMKKIEEIKPYSNNPRKNKEAVKIVKKSIKEFGFKVPIILDKNDEIIAGHTRLEASKELKLKEVPVIYAKDLTPEQVKAFRIMDNKSQEYAEWDLEKLKIELGDLKNLDFDIDLTGFDSKEISKIWNGGDAKEDNFDVENSLKKPKYKVKRGEIYQLGSHRLMCGDSTKKADVDKLINNKIDAIITDPPYGVDYVKKNEFLNKQDKGNRIQRGYANDEINRDYNKFYNDILGNVLEYLNDYNSIYIFLASTRMYECLKSFKDLNLRTSMILVWVKNNHVMARTDYFPKHEFIVYGWKGKHKFYGKSAMSVFNYDKPLVNDLHPTMKPIGLMAEIIQNATQERMNIYEPFGGSGSTLIACEQTNRKCYMMELDEYYCSVIIERWEKLTGKKAEKIK